MTSINELDHKVEKPNKGFGSNHDRAVTAGYKGRTQRDLNNERKRLVTKERNRMKLRNKKTGEIVDLSVGHITDTHYGDFIQIKPVACLENKGSYLYDTFAKFSEDWEDYKPSEPLIKDSKIRKAVRAWAEASKFEHLIYWYKSDEDYVSFMDGESELEIMFDSPNGMKGLKDDRNYTITELCGEVEE